MERFVTFALGLPALLPKKHDILCFFLRHSASYLCGLVLSSASLIAACCSPGFCSFVRFWCLSLYWSALVLFYGCYFRRGDVAARIEVLEDWHFDSFALSFLYWLCCVRVCLNKRCHIHSRSWIDCHIAYHHVGMCAMLSLHMLCT